MNITEYVKNIRFRSVQPMEPLKVRFTIRSPEQLQGARALLERIDEYQTELPENDREMRARLKPILDAPRMSTLAIGATINRLVNELPGDMAYVNVGVWNGFTLLAGILGNPDKRVVGVDNFSEFGGPRAELLERFERFRSPRHDFYDMDYVRYFETQHEGSIGFYFYDGEHSYANQLRGLQVAEPFFSDDCYILVDDTNWEDPRSATEEFVRTSSNAYEVLVDEATAWNAHPTFWNGLMILRRQA